MTVQDRVWGRVGVRVRDRVQGRVWDRVGVQLNRESRS